MADLTYLQGRVVAPTYAEAVEAIRARMEAKGYEAGEMRVWACPVQPWAGRIWFEYLCTIGRRGDFGKVSLVEIIHGNNR